MAVGQPFSSEVADACQSAFFFFSHSGIWIWFHFELRASENETKAV
jgi:hypothetical protein